MALNQDTLTRRETKTAEGRIFRLIYRSHSRIPGAKRDRELGEIFRGARAKNGAAGITGALLIYGDWFAQALEGPEAAVRDLFDRIKRDSRHDSIEVRQEGLIDDRVFSRWAMARVAEHGDADIFLVAGAAGLVESSPRKSTSDQERILDVMRDATRGYGLGS